MFDSVSFHEIFSTDTPLLEIFIRGSIMYLGLFLMLRFILKRQTGSVSITDILLVVLLADAAQNGMADDYKTVTDGLFLVATLIFWDWALDTLSYHSDYFNRLVNPKEVPLIRNGRALDKNLRREMMTKDELLGHLREKGVEHIRDVKLCNMESGGEVSVVTYRRNIKPKTKKMPA